MSRPCTSTWDTGCKSSLALDEKLNFIVPCSMYYDLYNILSLPSMEFFRLSLFPWVNLSEFCRASAHCDERIFNFVELHAGDSFAPMWGFSIISISLQIVGRRRGERDPV